MIASPYTLLSRLATVKNGLEDARITLCSAATAHAKAKRALDLAEAHELRRGLEGKNEKERTAQLRRELTDEYASSLRSRGRLERSKINI